MIRINGRRHKLAKQFFLVVCLLIINKETNCQLVTTSNEEAKEGDAEVVMTCDYSQFTSTTPDAIRWDELNENDVIIDQGFVNNNKLENGRFRLIVKSMKADLVMSQPVRSDSQRRFQCQIRASNGDTESSNQSILTVYYLDQPLLDASSSTVYKGQSVTFTCSKPDGYPIPHNTWYKDGQTVNTNNPSRYEIVNYSTESVIKIKLASKEDGGNYTCKAESDQFKGDDAKTSEGKQLIVYYVAVNFTSKDGLATCTAEGYPKPSLVLILQDGKDVEKGENTATIEITDEICQSNLTCYAENEKLNETTSLENCNTAGGRTLYIIVIVVICVAVFLWLLLLGYVIFCKNIEWSNTDINTMTVEGDEPVEMSWKYRPSIARFKTFEIKKDNKVLGSNQQQFSTVCQFVCYCCLYFCGFFCIEYCSKSYKKKHGSSNGNRSGEEYQMVVNEEQGPDSTEIPVMDAKTVSRQKSQTSNDENNTLVEPPGTSNERVKVFTNGRGRISLTLKNPARSDSGKYNCSIEGSRQQYPGVNNLSVCWIEINQNYSTEKSTSNFEMQCRYGPSDMPLTGYKWKKIKEDGTTEIEDCSKDSRFEVRYQNNILSLKIKNVKLKDAGMYQCEVTNGKQILKGATQLTVERATPKMKIPADTSINEGLDLF